MPCLYVPTAFPLSTRPTHGPSGRLPPPLPPPPPCSYDITPFREEYRPLHSTTGKGGKGRHAKGLAAGSGDGDGAELAEASEQEMWRLLKEAGQGFKSDAVFLASDCFTYYVDPRPPQLLPQHRQQAQRGRQRGPQQQQRQPGPQQQQQQGRQPRQQQRGPQAAAGRGGQTLHAGEQRQRHRDVGTGSRGGAGGVRGERGLVGGAPALCHAGEAAGSSSSSPAR